MGALHNADGAIEDKGSTLPRYASTSLAFLHPGPPHSNRKALRGLHIASLAIYPKLL